MFRTLEDVKRLMSFANLDEDEHMPKIQNIYFSENMDTDTYKFLEINTPVLNALEEGTW